MRKIIVTEMSKIKTKGVLSSRLIFFSRYMTFFLVIFETLKNKQGRICVRNSKYEKLKPRIQIQTFRDSWTSVTRLVHLELLFALF